MKPNFALNLSHEGISLLHRAKTGWLHVGGVALDDSDLNEQLRILRRTAADLDSGGLTTKLVIPNSQVLYTKIEAPGPDTTARISQIRDGLIGLTPYDVNELVFDWRVSGTQAHVAVVARETLQEAEAFAAEFRFNPVSFVAMPVNGTFDGEPFFGPAEHAASLLENGETIEPDVARMTVLGPYTGGGPGSNTEPQAADQAPKPAAPKEDSAAAVRPDATSDPKPKPSKKADPAAKPPADATPAEGSDPKPPAPQSVTDTAPSQQPVTFTSRRSASPPLAKAPAGTESDPVTPPLPRPRIVPQAPDTTAEPGPDDEDVPELPAWRSANRRDTTPMLMTAAHTADVDDPGDRRRPPRKKTLAVGAALAGTLGKLGQGAAANLRAPDEPQLDTAGTAARAEAEALTVFGERGRGKIRGKPQYLGLILTVLLLLALAVLALWSTYFLNERRGALPGPEEAAPQISKVEPAQPAISSPAPLDIPVPSAPTPTPATDSASETTPPAEPIGAASQQALGEIPAPGTPGNDSDAATLIESLDPEEIADLPVQTALLEDPSGSLLESPAPDRVTSPPPTLAEAQASYAATGIWPRDPEPLPEQAGGGDLEDIYVASIDPAVSSLDAVALPPEGSLLNDLTPVSLRPPAELGRVYELDARGLVRATPDGALTPEGVRIFSGLPQVVPGPRPGSDTADAAPPATDTTVEAASEQPAAAGAPVVNDPAREALRQIRPRLRPDTLQESNERSRLGGFSRSELATIRPTMRPPSVREAATSEQPQLAQADTTASDPEAETASATDLAVAASLSPKVRPTDFSSRVSRALEEIARNDARVSPPPAAAPPPAAPAPAPAQEVAAARVPSIPSSASVARQATQQSAIHLRDINLVGVYGSPSNRRALVRLKSGRFVKVEVGDRVDGGRVAAIGSDELRYVKGGRNITLKMPKG